MSTDPPQHPGRPGDGAHDGARDGARDEPATDERATGERGVTLAELLVCSALLVLVLPFAGSLLHSAVVTQRDVQSVTAASTMVQAVATSVGTGVRNASALRYSAQPDGTELLLARTVVGSAGPAGDEDWKCQAWYYEEGVLYTRRVSAAGASTPALSAPSAADLALWTVLATGVAPRDDGVVDGTDTVLTASPAAAPTRVDLDVVASAGARKPVAVATAFTARPQGQTGGAPCF